MQESWNASVGEELEECENSTSATSSLLCSSLSGASSLLTLKQKKNIHSDISAGNGGQARNYLGKKRGCGAHASDDEQDQIRSRCQSGHDQCVITV